MQVGNIYLVKNSNIGFTIDLRSNKGILVS